MVLGFFSGKKWALAVFLLLVFFIYFRLEPIPFNTDDFGYFVYSKLVLGGFSEQTLQTMKEFNLVSRPFAAVLYLPFYLVFGDNFSAGLLFFHLFLSIINLAVIFFNYKLFKKVFSRQAALLSSFLLGTSFFFIYNGWYMASININIATLFLILCALAFTEAKTNKALAFATLAILFGVMTRETTIFSFFLMAAVFVLSRKDLRAKPITYVALALPFIVFFAFSFIIFGSGEKGTAINPFHLGFLTQNPDILGTLGIYFDYFNYYYLSTFFAFAILAMAASLLILFFGKKKAKTKPKTGKTQPFIAKTACFFEKHGMTLALVAWLLGALVPLVLANQISPRYIIPVLPPLFGLTSCVISKYFLSRTNCAMQKLFFAVILLNLAFWVLFLNSGFVFGTLKPIATISQLSFAFNVLFYLIIAVPILAVVFFVFKELSAKAAAKGAALALLVVFVSLATVVQANEVNVFFVTHYHNADIAFKANEFLAKNAPRTTTIYNQQDLSWIWGGSLLAFGRQDIRLEFGAPSFSSLKAGDWLVYQSRPGQSIGQLIDSNKSHFELLASFGGEYKKFPRSTMDKTSLAKDGTLFHFFLDAADTIEIYRFKG